MKPFTYQRALSVDTAVAESSDKSRLLAGGIDLLGQLKEGLVETDKVVAVTHIPGLDAIEKKSAAWTIGANVTIAALAAHADLGRAFPGLAAAARDVASPQIRNVSTVAGNLLQGSRCWYYRHRDVRCMKKGGDTCYAREGEHKYHALFTGGYCISPLVSNLAVALAVLDASVVVRGRGGERRLTMAELYAPAWEDHAVQHALKPGELLTAIEIPLAARRSAFVQASEKASFDWALVSCAASIEIDGGVVRQARIALGAVSPVPYRDARAEKSLEGKKLDETTADAAAALLLEKAEPLPHNAYKVPIARALIKRALLAAATTG
jgi:xanthine dehydrogenase YagS FAD-binding subunit